MALTRETKLGTIAINDNVIAKAILRSAAPVSNKLFLSTEKGKILGSPSRISASELSSNVLICESEDRCDVTFYAVTRFGASIKNVTETVLDMLQKEFQNMFPAQRGVLTIKIVGVKSKNIAERNIEVKREYEASR